MKESHHRYARHPGADGPVDLTVRLFLPPAADAPAPLLVWLHSGGFRKGSPDSSAHQRIAGLMARHGYASAFPQYRLATPPEALRPPTRALLDDLVADAEASGEEMQPFFYRAPALAVVEDCPAFLDWIGPRRGDLGLSGDTILGGSSAGGIAALNTLFLAPRIGLDLPAIRTAVILSGGFAYPSFYRPCPTRILAIHGTNEAQVPVGSIRRFAYLAADHCTLIEDAAHQHGDFRLNRDEALRVAVRRIVRFDRGAAIDPVRVAAETRRTKTAYRICLVTCVKNEGPFLLEWIAHNRAIGVTDFIVFSNDCDDGTAELLDRLDAMGVVSHIANPSMALGSDQHLSLALLNARYHRDFPRCDYCLVTDVDEFLQIDTADGTLNGLLAATGHPDVISVSELIFGFGGVERFRDDLVTAQFRLSDDPDPKAERARRGVKSLVRIDPSVTAYGNHRPHYRPGTTDALDWVDGSGQPVPDAFATDGRRGLDARGRTDLVRLNHYTLRSGESMLVKYARGDAARKTRMRPRYFRDRNASAAVNDGFAPHLDRLMAELAPLIADPDIARLHAACVARHRARIDALRADPDLAEVWQAIRDEVARAGPDTVAETPADPADTALRVAE